jgi:hypothetical protein
MTAPSAPALSDSQIYYFRTGKAAGAAPSHSASPTASSSAALR